MKGAAQVQVECADRRRGDGRAELCLKGVTFYYHGPRPEYQQVAKVAHPGPDSCRPSLRSSGGLVRLALR